MPSEPRKRNTGSKKALAEALLTLLQDKQLDQITVKEITTLAGVGYATFFRNYEDKEALLHDLTTGEINNLLTMTLPIFFTGDSQASNQALCAYIWQHRELWTRLLTSGAAASLREEYLHQARKLMADMNQQPSDLPGDLAVTFSVTALLEILTWWLRQDKPVAVREMASILHRLTVMPIMNDQGNIVVMSDAGA